MSTIPIQVIDLRVAVYIILRDYKTIQENCTPNTAKHWLKAAWSTLFNRGYTGMPYQPHTVIVVDDHPPYWRSAYLAERDFRPYKGGRKEKESLWFVVYQAGMEYLLQPKNPMLYLSIPGYEADDLAAAIVKLCPKKRHIYLHTIDSDWLGLVQDNVTWAGMGVWTPRTRNLPECIAWAKKRLKVDIEKPSDIWTTKQKQGDTSDNLAPGSPLEVIDLLNPPPEHDLANNPVLRIPILECVSYTKDNTNLFHLKTCVDWVRQNGLSHPWINFNSLPVKFGTVEKVSILSQKVA